MSFAPRSNQSGLIEALHVDGPAPDHAEELMLFGRFVGSWTLEWSGGESQPATGELHFGWVLGGRAIQDIWIVPGRGQPGEGRPPLAFHGSTLRFFDEKIGAWRSTWIEPINGRVRRFIGRAAGDDIVLLSDEDEPQLRWRFTDITPTSFTWLGEISGDGGATWTLEEQMHARRVHQPGEPPEARRSPSARRSASSLYPGTPYEYSAEANGLIFTAGACPLDEHGAVVAPGDFEAQAIRAVENLIAALARHAIGPEALVKTTIFVVANDRSNMISVWEVIASRLGRAPSTLLGVSLLGYPDQLVEIEAIAIRRGPST